LRTKTPDLTTPANEALLLATKLFIPRPRPNLVARPRLIARLNQARRLTLLSAPAGFGKSTLLAEWVHSLTGPNAPKVAWLSLDAGDNEPRRFLMYCVAALQTVQPQVGQSLLAALRHSPSAPPHTLLTLLINEMAALAHPLLFVLDDYHLIQSPTIHQGLAFLLDNLPPPAQLVIASRQETPLPLASWRGRGELLELRGPDLRFTTAEIATFLQDTMGLTMPAPEVALLSERTEGWIAGLQLVALSLQGQHPLDAAGMTAALSGSHRYIFDYLLAEVLHRQPPHIQQFLQQTSILERLCGPLAEALVDFTGAAASGQEILEYLEQSNLFIIPLDTERHWYRYHHLFADLLRHRLAQSTGGAAEIKRLHRQAGAWFEQHGLDTEAMQHALAAVDAERVIRLARQKAATMLSRNEFITLVSWFDALPRQSIRTRPGISLLKAWAMVLTGQLELMEAYLQEAEQALAAESEPEAGLAALGIRGEITTLRATVAYFRRDMAQAVTLYRQALANLPEDNLFLRGCVLQSLASAHSWQGDVTAAAQAFNQATTVSRQTGNWPVSLIALWNLGQLQLEQGHPRRAMDFFSQGIDLTAQQPEQERAALLPLTGQLHMGMAGVLYQWNELAAAAEQLAIGLKLGESAQESGTLTGGYLALAQLEWAQGHPVAAHEALQQATEASQRYGGPYYWVGQAELGRAQLWLREGNLRAVSDWFDERQLTFAPTPHPIPYLHEEEYLLLARLLLAQAQQTGGAETSDLLASAGQILGQILAEARNTRRTGRVLEVLVLQALIHHTGHRSETALAALAEALHLAEPEGYLRMFLDEGEPLVELLRQAAARKIGSGYVSRLLAAMGHQGITLPSADLLDPLSERELEILQLISQGMSNKELAEKLVLTVGTIKWHLNNIYSKLGVRSRTQAVARARKLGLE
jgi:LuxR family maltose regulon positive regulatory protein